jgi:hypothetical protein
MIPVVTYAVWRCGGVEVWRCGGGVEVVWRCGGAEHAGDIQCVSEDMGGRSMVYSAHQCFISRRLSHGPFDRGGSSSLL